MILASVESQEGLKLVDSQGAVTRNFNYPVESQEGLKRLLATPHIILHRLSVESQEGLKPMYRPNVHSWRDICWLNLKKG